MVSLHDCDARPIAKGRLGKPVEFEYKAQVIDNDDGIVVDHTTDDGRQAMDAGVDGVIVSNHGGRQVDSGIGVADALIEMAAAINGRIPIIYDSGIRSGADIVKALALGADAVTVGRPHIYGLALAGRRGVAEVLQNLIAELDLILALIGVRCIDEFNLDLLRRVS